MSDPILHLPISQSPVFLLNSRLGLFTAAPMLNWKRPFSRSYGAILPSSLAMIHSSALGFSPQLPVSVYGTSRIYLCLEGFLGSLLGIIITSNRSPQCTIVFQLPERICLSRSTPTHFNPLFRQGANLTRLRHSIAVYTSTGILTCFPSTSPRGFALGPD